MNNLHRYARLAAATAAMAACFSFPAFAAERSDDVTGPGVQMEQAAEEESPAEDAEPEKGELLGVFTTTGYCNCEKCSGGHALTYSGTVPTAKHTISADLNQYPIGTKLWIDGTVYTVEDMGSAVNGRKLDIYYATHDEALAAGMYTAEVFRAD